MDQTPDTHRHTLQVIFSTAGYEGFQSTLFRDEVQGPSASAAPSPPQLLQPLSEGLFLSFDVQMNQASAVRSPTDL